MVGWVSEWLGGCMGGWRAINTDVVFGTPLEELFMYPESVL